MAMNPMPTVPHRSFSASKKAETKGKRENSVSKFKRFEKTGEIEIINKPHTNNADAFLVESFIFFIF